MLGDLFRSGFDIVDDHEDADAIVVNTCSFVEEAKTESLEAIMQAAQLKADGKPQRVIVTGCLAQRYSEDLAGDKLLRMCNKGTYASKQSCMALSIIHKQMSCMCECCHAT